MFCADIVPTTTPTQASSIARDGGGSTRADCETLDDVTYVDAVSKNLCTESWAVSSQPDNSISDGVACVQWTAQFKRDLTTVDTSYDAALDYVDF